MGACREGVALLSHDGEGFTEEVTFPKKMGGDWCQRANGKKPSGQRAGAHSGEGN